MVSARRTSLEFREKIARMRLIRSENIGPVTFRELLLRYGSAVDALKALPGLARRGGRKGPLRIATEQQIEQELISVERAGAMVLHIGTKEYPVPLANIEDAPPVLFALGHLHLLERTCIAIVGGRNASIGGHMLAKQFAGAFGAAGLVTVSGMARGIDASAHEGSLKFGTIAVLAGGVDVLFPPENATLYEQIQAQGLVISEAVMGMRPQGRHFPRRNRIISGLSRSVVLIEAKRKSGSLITARYAADQGRTVYAVPGSPQDPRSMGCNDLIRDGATLVQDPEDVLQEWSDGEQGLLFEPEYSTPQPPLIASDDDIAKARAFLNSSLSVTPVHLDEVVRLSGLFPAALRAALIELELAGIVLRHPGERFSRKP